jgi:hypothetical protein
MRRSLRAGLLSAVALLPTASLSGLTGPSAPPAPQSADAGTAAISGVVTDAVTGRPIAGASVSIFGIIPGAPANAQPPRPPAVLTDARGRFVFVNLSSTPRYTLIATRAGYALGNFESPAEVSNSASIRVDQRLPIGLADGEWKRDADIRMWRLGTIGGRVLDEHGEAVIGAAVRIYSRRLVAGRELLVPGAVVTTDDRGAYRIPFVDPGRYVVAVLSVQATVPASTADGPRSLPLGGLQGRGQSGPPVSRTEANGASIDVDGRHRLVLTNFVTPPPPAADRARAYAPVFHPNARGVNDALAIEIDLGAGRGDIDFQLVPLPTARVSGHVTGAVQGAANMLLRLMAPGTEHLGFGSEVATTLVEVDGTFTFLNVPAGVYTLVAAPSVAEMSSGGGSEGRLPRGVGYGPARGLSEVYEGAGFSAMWWRSEAGATVWGRVPVSVGDADVTGIELPLRTAATVRGRVAFDDPKQPEPNQRFTVKLEPASGDPSLGMPNAVTAAGDETHAFEIGGLQGGHYLLRFQRFGGWRVKSVTLDGVDLTDTGFDGALGQDYNGVVVTVTKGGAELSGVVRDGAGGPSHGAVILFPADPGQWVDYGLTPDRLHSTRAASDGTYSFTAILEGNYLVVAVPLAQAGGWLDPNFLAAAAPQATRISLPTAAPKTQDLRVSEVVVR